MFNKILSYLELKHFGWLELLFASYIILCGYNMILSSSVLVILLMSIIAISRKGVDVNYSLYKPIIIFLIYYLVHDLLLLLITGGGYIKSYVGNATILFSIPLISGAINYTKLKSLLNWVTVISVAGLLYHVILVTRGQVITPIQIPFLTMDQERIQHLQGIGFFRPTSFFVEPQAYASFILVPLFISLFQKKYIWSAILLVSLLLSTSTTGIFAAFFMLVVFVFNQMTSHRIKIVQVIVILVFMVALYYLLVNSSLFATGYEKILNTDFSSTERLNLGITIVSSMDPLQLIFGAPYFSSVDYCLANGLGSLVDENGMAYVSTIWYMILKYGIIGLVLYLYIFYYYAIKCRELIPYVLVYVVTLFSNPDTIGGFFAFSVIFILSFVIEHKNIKGKSKRYEISTY